MSKCDISLFEMTRPPHSSLLGTFSINVRRGVVPGIHLQ